MTAPSAVAAEITPLQQPDGELLLIVALLPLAFVVAGLLIDGPSAVLRGLGS